ncbi:MAG TPA: fasciclin domain-containing protein [bacterium]|nr:fasciclin domain-containing protein [bacterium]
MKRIVFAAVLCLSTLNTAHAATVFELVSAQTPAFGAALETSGFAAMLKGGGVFTIFVPSSEAFAKLNDKLLNDPERLKAVMAYHIVPSKITSADLKQLVSAKTVNGKELKVSSKGETIEVGKAKVTQGESLGSNGMIYTIDSVLIP